MFHIIEHHSDESFLTQIFRYMSIQIRVQHPFEQTAAGRVAQFVHHPTTRPILTPTQPRTRRGTVPGTMVNMYGSHLPYVFVVFRQRTMFGRLVRDNVTVIDKVPGANRHEITAGYNATASVRRHLIADVRPLVDYLHFVRFQKRWVPLRDGVHAIE